VRTEPHQRPVLRVDIGAIQVTSSTRASLGAPLVVRCILVIAWLKVLLRVRGFPDTLAWIRSRTERLAVTTAAEIEVVRAVEYGVATAAALFPGRALCLEQSLALYYILRCDGVAARFRQGVQAHPFAAHAWIEYRAVVINDVVEHVQRYTPMPDQLP
jgi:hypothetical protein